MKVGDRYIWCETDENKKLFNREVKGVVIEIPIYWGHDNFIIEWSLEGVTTKTKYSSSYLQNETRIQIDKQYYREQKLKELGI